MKPGWSGSDSDSACALTAASHLGGGAKICARYHLADRTMAFTYGAFSRSGGFSGFRFGAQSYDPHARRAALDRLDLLATLFDTALVVPGTNIRFGVEALLRLVPGVGDAAASALSCYLLYEAYRLGVPKILFARMAANVALEGALGAVPVAGDAFDVFFRANRRNVALLRAHFAAAGAGAGS
jgi:hypothetical protein